MSPVTVGEVNAIAERNRVYRKWLEDYDSCTLEEDNMCSGSIDDLVYDIQFLLDLIYIAELELRK